MNPLMLLGLTGAGTGLGLAIVFAIAVPARPQLADALTAPYRDIASAHAEPGNLIQHAGTPVVGALAVLGLPRATVRANLRALNRPIETHLAQQAGLAILAAITAPAYALALAVIGVRTPLPILAGGTVLLASAAYLLPTRVARSAADRLREQIRYATSALLDLVAVMLAAGSGLEEAFATAADAGTGPGHHQLRAALGAARTTHSPVWDELAALGQRTDIPELTELAATSLLAGTEGAKVRDTLATKAASLRSRLLAVTEAKAVSATERMGMPTVLLMIGFLIFTCYPALEQVLKSL